MNKRDIHSADRFYCRLPNAKLTNDYSLVDDFLVDEFEIISHRLYS